MEVSLINFGATIRSIRVPTDSGVIDAVLSYANLDDFLRDKFYICLLYTSDAADE